jgi:hypothetical protein
MSLNVIANELKKLNSPLRVVQLSANQRNIKGAIESSKNTLHSLSQNYATTQQKYDF